MANMKWLSDLLDLAVNSIRLGGRTGGRITNNGGKLEIRTDDGSALNNLAVAEPTSNDEAANRSYVRKRAVRVAHGFDGNSVPAAGTYTDQYIVCTTAGGSYAIGDLAYDDGTTVTRIPAEEGRQLNVTAAITGGTISFDADSIYVWDSTSSSWIKIGDVGGFTGAVRTTTISFTYADDGTAVAATTNIPANAFVFETRVEITTPFNGTSPQIEVGYSGSANAFMAADENYADEAGTYQNIQQTNVGATAVTPEVLFQTSASDASAGAGVAYIFFAVPNS